MRHNNKTMVNQDRSVAYKVQAARCLLEEGKSSREVQQTMGISRQTMTRYRSEAYDRYLLILPQSQTDHPQLALPLPPQPIDRRQQHQPCVQERDGGSGQFLPGCADGTGRPPRVESTYDALLRESHESAEADHAAAMSLLPTETRLRLQSQSSKLKFN